MKRLCHAFRQNADKKKKDTETEMERETEMVTETEMVQADI